MKRGWHDWGYHLGWEIELLKKGGLSETEAQAAVVIHWASQGDLRPLGMVLGGNYFYEDTCMPAIAKFLVKLIEADRLHVAQTRRGAGQKPDAFARDAAIAYLHGLGVKVPALAEQFRVSEDTVELAITKVRKLFSK